jgi:predicted metal-dependent peptidase
MTPREKIIQARAICTISEPFWAALMFSTPLIETDAVPIAATDGMRILYNPEMFETLTVDEVLFIYVHEVLHIILDHLTRQAGLHHEIFNAAADYVVNLIVKDTKLGKFPSIGGLIDEKYRGMTMEQVYDLLLKQCKKQGGKGRKGKKGKGSGQGEPGEPGDGDLDTSSLPKDGLAGDLLNKALESPEAAAERRRAVKDMVARAATVARMQGKMPAGMERLVEGILNPPQPWADVLREFALAAAKDDSTWSVPNRRFEDIILPSRWSQKIGEVVLIVDTSGSITDTELMQAQGEMREIADRLKPTGVRVVYCDAAVAGEQFFEDGDDIVLQPKGGGGTDMRVAFDHVEPFDPEFVILMTDGFTPWPAQPTPFPTIICCSTGTDCPDWARVIRMR